MEGIAIQIQKDGQTVRELKMPTNLKYDFEDGASGA
jgi:hypothetical protein